MSESRRIVMSLADAKSLHHRFTVLRKYSKYGPLTTAQKALLSEAAQVIRQHSKRNPPSVKDPVVVYRRVLMIHAQKVGPHRCDAECKRCDHCYYHPFKPGAVMYGLPNGDLLIRSTKK